MTSRTLRMSLLAWLTVGSAMIAGCAQSVAMAEARCRTTGGTWTVVYGANGATSEYHCSKPPVLAGG